ncbi:hypothetical protein AVENLUH13518_02522 [Acinetobacter venetianus]|jgi:hypothetical protein|uniref:Uncharacterized protein n=1 Tax=Acinetobacter venetianus TaxID=52133 RepID=A0A150HSI2_9GAMM|nr:hypothetical protein AVENLUH13518_02522 [Acinetobacter venetianus]
MLADKRVFIKNNRTIKVRVNLKVCYSRAVFILGRISLVIRKATFSWLVANSLDKLKEY